MTKISTDCARSAWKAGSSSAYQSSQRVCAISCHVVPCPGSLGSQTLRPASARYSAHGRSDWGLPVNPWQSSTPVVPPTWVKGSAPGITGMAGSSPFHGPASRVTSGSAPAHPHRRRPRPLRHPHGRDRVATYVRVLLGGQGGALAVPQAVPALGGGHREPPERGTCDHRHQPPVVF